MKHRITRNKEAYIENEIGPLFYTIHKNQLKWIKDLNVRPETVKLLEENIGGKLLDTGVGNDFLDLMPEEVKVKINKCDLIELESFYTTKETIGKMKENLQNGNRYLQMIWQSKG